MSGSNYANRNNYIDLDPTYKDRLGRPLMRMTFDFHDNELKMSAYLTDRLAEIAKAMDPVEITASPRKGRPLLTTSWVSWMRLSQKAWTWQMAGAAAS